MRTVVRVVAGAAAVVAVTSLVGAALDPAPAGPSVVGVARLAAPDGTTLGVRVPAGFRVASSGRRVGLISDDARLRLAVSVPDAVVGPAGGPVPVPADPVGWLTAHPGLDVLSTGTFQAVRPLALASSRTVRATTADFAVSRAPTSAPLGRFSTMRLFCDAGDDGCGRVSTQVVVRATFVEPPGARPVLVAAYWPRGSDDDPDHGTAPMPAALEAAYRLAVADVVRQGGVRTGA